MELKCPLYNSKGVVFDWIIRSSMQSGHKSFLPHVAMVTRDDVVRLRDPTPCKCVSEIEDEAVMYDIGGMIVCEIGSRKRRVCWSKTRENRGFEGWQFSRSI